MLAVAGLAEFSLYLGTELLDRAGAFWAAVERLRELLRKQGKDSEDDR